MPRKATYEDGVFGPDLNSPAEDLVNDAWDATTPAKQVKLARAALEVDLDAIDAYNILGLNASTLAEAIALYREATRIGERLFKPALDDPETAWWGFIGTRPWMRAMHNLGLSLMEAGDQEEAALTFERLLALNPNDNQGIRYLLLRVYAEAGDYKQCKRLFSQYKDEGAITFTATQLLVDLATKETVDAERHFARINGTNTHFLTLLAFAARKDRWPPPMATEFITYGSKEEAAIYLGEFKHAWLKQPKILAGFLQAYDATAPNKGKAK